MTSVSGLEISIFRIPLDVAGQQLISQQCGYFHAWRFLNSDGTLSLEGEIGASFGGQWNAERIPFTYNSRLALGTPVERVLIDWTAQPGKVAEILLTRDPRGLDGQNTPARQLVFQGQATTMRNAAQTVGNAASTIVPADTRRSRVIISSLLTNTDRVVIGGAGVSLAAGLPLDPGASFVGFSSALYQAISGTAGQQIRILEELA
jgi:hypothetical protein